jgi:hypothetical protein
MKSHKIWRLEFVSDKIEGRDSKRKVMRIHFDHSMKKWHWLKLSMGGGHGISWSSMGGTMGSTSERGERGKERGARW